MQSIPFALSLSKYVNSAGAYVGFASLLAVALLVILYFAHARETTSLRDHLHEAHDRIDALESRIAQLIQLQSTRQQRPAQEAAQQPAVVPRPASVPARPMGSAVASLRRVSNAPANGGEDGELRPAAPAGVGAPALASATTALPEPVSAQVRVVTPAPETSSEDTVIVPAGAGDAGNGNHTGNGAPAVAAVAAAPAALAPAVAAARGGETRTAPPRVQIRPDATGGTGGRRSAPPERGSLLEEPPERQWGRRLLPLVGAIVLVAFIVVVLLKVTANNNTTTPPVPTVAQSTKTTKAKSTAPVFNPHDVQVAVLNGTSVAGLAQDVSNALAKQGYRAGSITNAAVQTETTTVVYYMHGQKTAAQHVAKALKLKPASVHAATQAVIQSCATSPTAAVGSCQGDVIVSVGSDRTSLASTTTTA